METIKLLFLLLLIQTTLTEDNGLGLTPPMGWNTWCTLGACSRDYCFDHEIRQVADALHSTGMKDLGYNYINLDDCWSSINRTANGDLQPDPTRFPYGMKALADDLHKKGFKLGIYTCAGFYTCVGHRPGSYGNYQRDAETLASWGIDYIKMDWCNHILPNGTALDPKIVYGEMSRAINATGRQIFFSLCEWGEADPWLWGPPISNSWRMHFDHHDNWESTAEVIEAAAGLGKFAGSGAWNDLDFLMTGGQGCQDQPKKICPGQTHIEYQTEFSMWALVSSNLLVATNIEPEYMTPEKKQILMNKEIIAINQDKLGKAGDRIGYSDCSENGNDKVCQIWSKDLSGNSKAVNLYNSGNQTHAFTLSFAQVGFHGRVHLRDLWAHRDLGIFSKQYQTEVPPHGVKVLKLKSAH